MSVDNSLKLFHPVYIGGLKRLGNKYDGGYIVHYPSLKDADYLLNYGVGYNVEFEKDFFKETGLPTLAFDPTLSGLSPVIEKLKKFKFTPFFRQVKNSLVWLVIKGSLKNHKITYVEEGVSDKDSEKYKTLAYHFKKYGLHDKKVILKLDVEGAEYPIFNDPATYDILPNAIQILMEIHYMERSIENLKDIMKNILKTHSLVHIHSNNHAGTFKHHGKNVPEAIEVTFLLNTYIAEKKYSTASYPIPEIDQPCDRLKEDIVLDFFY